MLDKEHAQRKNDKTDAGKVTTGEQTSHQAAGRSACCGVGTEPALECLFCGCFGGSWGGVGWRGRRAWAAAVCRCGSSSVVLSSHSYARLFQLLPPAEGVNPNHLFLEPELPCLFTPLAFMWLQWPLFIVAQLCARLGF